MAPTSVPRSSIERLVRDVKALGASTPLRAIYEGSKRSDLHRLLFRQVDPEVVPRSVGLTIGTVIPSGANARRRCINDARLIREQGTRAFGRRVSTGAFGPWALDPLAHTVWPTDTPWWRIDVRSDDRLSDVKFIWEVGRHRDLVVLARAAVLESDGPWLEQLTDMLWRWVDECTPETGIHWYSSLELALRAIAWAQVIALVGSRINDELRAKMDHQLMASARHIIVELPYTVSSMKNNHLLGDGLGLVVLGKMFPNEGKRWQRLGDRLMLKQLRRHMRPDGSMIEDSLSYHRFVLEMLLVRQLLGDAPDEVGDALEQAGLHLFRLGVLEGPVPQFGDWDEGRVLADSGEAGSTAGSAWAALALRNYTVPRCRYDEHDELAWYLDYRSGVKNLPEIEESWVEAGGFVVITAGKRQVWVKAGTGPSHQHADIGSVWIRQDGQWITRDPGTGTYNGPLEVRNGFRTSAAHPVWVPRGEDQLRPHRAFRWLGSASTSRSNIQTLGDNVALLVVHDAFERRHGRVARVVLVAPTGVTIIDAVERPQGTWTMTVPLGDQAGPQGFFGLESATVHRGQNAPWRGWHSPTYGEWEESTWLELSKSHDGPYWWGHGRSAKIDVEIIWTEVAVEVRLSTGAAHTYLRSEEQSSDSK